MAVLKDERRELYGEAISLSAINDPVVYEVGAVTYRAWNHTISGLWDGYDRPVRVIRSEETKTVRHHSKELGKWDPQEERAEWMWVTNLPLSSWFEKYHTGLSQPVADRKQVFQ